MNPPNSTYPYPSNIPNYRCKKSCLLIPVFLPLSWNAPYILILWEFSPISTVISWNSFPPLCALAFLFYWLRWWQNLSFYWFCVTDFFLTLPIAIQENNLCYFRLNFMRIQTLFWFCRKYHFKCSFCQSISCRVWFMTEYWKSDGWFTPTSNLTFFKSCF